MTRRRHKRLCYLCGKPGKLTREHVVPRSLFLKPLPSNMITEPAHRHCNQSYAKDEEYFRFALTSEERTYEQQVAGQVWDQKVFPGLQHSPKFANRILSQLHDVELHSPGGLYIGRATAVYGEQDRIQRVINKIARGLLYRPGIGWRQT